MAEPVWCCGVMVEAANPHWLHPTSILDVYKVFEHLEMLWMGIWVHTYAVLHVKVGMNFRENGEWPGLYDVAVSWLTLQTPKDCIPHPYSMYTKCFSTLRCCCEIIGDLAYYLAHTVSRYRYLATVLLYLRTCSLFGFKPQQGFSRFSRNLN